jgi:DoxX-like family
MSSSQAVEVQTASPTSRAADASRWPARLGWAASGLVLVFFLIDALGKLLQIPQVLEGSQSLGYPPHTVVPIGVLLLIGAVLYAIPRSALVGAIYLTAFLGGAVAAHVRIGSPLFTHILFGVYVAALMWAGLVLRRRELLGLLVGRCE